MTISKVSIQTQKPCQLCGEIKICCNKYTHQCTKITKSQNLMKEMWEILFPRSQFALSSLIGDMSVHTEGVLRRAMHILDILDNLEEKEKQAWWVLWQSTRQGVHHINNCLHFIEQCKVLIRELQMQCSSDSCNQMQTVEKLKQVEELLVLLWINEHMRLRSNKISTYRMDLWQTGEGKRHVFTQVVQEFMSECNAMEELYRSKQREWQGVQWIVQWGQDWSKRFLEFVNLAYCWFVPQEQWQKVSKSYKFSEWSCKKKCWWHSHRARSTHSTDQKNHDWV